MEKSTIRTLFVDHSGLPGGGQLGLARFLRSPAGSSSAVAILGGGPAFDDVPSRQVHRLSTGESSVSMIIASLGLKRLISALGVESVVANSLRAAAVLAALHGVPEVKYINYLRVDLAADKTSFFRRWAIGKFVLPRFDGFISNSQWTGSTLPIGVSEKPAVVAYPVSGTASLASIPIQQRVSARPFTILSLSRVVAWKGVHVLVDAIAALNKVGYVEAIRVVVAGGTFHEDPAYARDLIVRTASEVPNVEFLGHVSDVEPLIAECDVVVSCSTAAEPFGQVIAQGLMAGRPVIATNVGGPREMIRDGVNGYLVPPGNAAALANTLRELIDDPTKTESMGRSARQSAFRFADEHTTVGLSRAVECVLSEVRRSGGRS